MIETPDKKSLQPGLETKRGDASLIETSPLFIETVY
jgi:hypothetical protein